MMRWLICVLVVITVPAWADTVVPTRTIRAMQVIEASDLSIKPVVVEGAYSAMHELIGLEAKIALYPGRPVRPGDVGPPAIIERNQLAQLVFSRGGLTIQTEGRALERAGIGDWIQVMNLASRTTVMGQVQANGTISVSN